MADYHAVLQRTLAGFKDPKPELRLKLYERARTTIARQLENRTPAVTGDALVAELDKLEYAIYEIERSFDPSYPPPTPAAEATPEPVQEPAPEPVPDPIQEPVAEPVSERIPPQPEPQAVAQPSFTDALAANPAVDIPEANPVPPAPPAAPEPAAFEPLDPPASVVDPLANPTENQAINDAAVDQWAEEFLAHQPGQPQAASEVLPAAEAAQPPAIDPAVDPVVAASAPAPDVSTSLPLPDELQQHPQVAPPADPSWDAAAEQVQVADAFQTPQAEAPVAPAPAAPAPAAPIPPLPTFDPTPDTAAEDPLEIPPAPGFGNGGTKRPRKRGWIKWLVLLLILILLGAGATYAWLNKEQVLEQVGLSDLLDSPTKPKPVKTISITPQDVSQDEPLAAPKVESRLNSDGEEISGTSNNPTPSTTTELQPVIETPSAAQPSDGSPQVAQDAILYEEGATPAENTVDAGRVVWSVIEEEPASGVPKEPAIRARIEIPERNVVLIMKIKRNADKALPASHLIELVFAVPDDFSGGSIGQVSRFVLKQSEQGRGEALVGVPARIADGIFLIALNNLDQARQKNESLLKTRDWIDIPLQYRTGRRALVTIEKGVPGTKVFDEVFEAWSKS
ncbi:MAG: hypothetical protein HRU27_08265 [Rhizobiaceae bacterium]|nr:hypothetical protein [Hyphomicrobiales bacterium]NRB30576.1 hypothetical protein [Rhizobiaceae bacterium]